MQSASFTRLTLNPKVFYTYLIILISFLVISLGCAHYMDTEGHWVTGMNNQVIWGIPHIFAIFLIVTSSGVLNIASIGSLFKHSTFKPFGRLSGLITISLLIGGLSILVLDLGRPDRLIIAMTHYNFKSIFTWNIFLYSGFVLIVACYLWTMMERGANKYTKAISILALLWRLTLTSGTGLIFGFLIAREAYDSAIMAPLFIAMSLAFGLATFMILLIIIEKTSDSKFNPELWLSIKRLLLIFIICNFYFTIMQHLNGLYATEHHYFENFALFSGSQISFLFWFGQIIIGFLTPLIIIFSSRSHSLKNSLLLSSSLIIVGGFFQLYVIIVGGQSFPLILFPGKSVSSKFFDGHIDPYNPSFVEFGLGIGGCIIALIIIFVAVRILDLIPFNRERKA